MQIFSKSTKRQERGFSLVETIVVVAILGVLVLVAIPVFGAIQSNARGATLTAAAHSAASEVSAALAEKPGARTPATAVVTRLNQPLAVPAGANSSTAIRYILTTGTSEGVVHIFTPNGTTINNVGQKRADNLTSETVFVYATDNRGNWVGAGTSQADHKIGAWL